MLKLKPQYFGHLMQRADLLEKTLMLGNIEGRRRRGHQRVRWLDGITDSMDMSLRFCVWFYFSWWFVKGFYINMKCILICESESISHLVVS